MNERKARLAGIGGAFPPLVSNREFMDVFGKKAAVLDRRMPVKTRYCGIDIRTGEALTTNTGMALEASLKAMAMAGISPADVDMILYSSATPDFLLPPCYTILQRKLGIQRCMGMDLRSGCSGFGAALVTAQQYIRTGMADTVLVVGSDLSSTRTSILYQDGIEEFPVKALFNLMLFGDGAGAVVLRSAGGDDEGIFACSLASTRPDCPPGSRVEVGGSVTPYPVETMRKEDWLIHQEPLLSEQLIPEVFMEAVDEFLTANSLSMACFDSFILPVDMPVMVEKALARFPDLKRANIVSIGSEGGSMVNAAVPLSLLRAWEQGRLARGKRVLIYSAENTQWQHAVIGLDCSF